MPTYVIKGVKCTLKDGVVKLATEHCYLCNYKKNVDETGHYHTCRYCGLGIDELENNIIHFAYAYQENWTNGWFAHAQCYKGKKGNMKNSYLYVINYKDKK